MSEVKPHTQHLDPSSHVLPSAATCWQEAAPLHGATVPDPRRTRGQAVDVSFGTQTPTEI